MESAAVETAKKPLATAFNTWWNGLAYRNKLAEWALYWMFVSGVLLWDPITISWSFERLVLVLHSLSSLVLFPLIVLPFWLSHRRLLATSKKAWLKVSGQWLDLLLLACGSSGVALLFVGNRGDSFGWWAYMIHLISSLILTPLLIMHAAKWSALKPVWSFTKRLLALFVKSSPVRSSYE